MKENIKLAFLGGDARQCCLASIFAQRGFECAVWGISDGCGNVGDAVRCRDWFSAINRASAVILPLPSSPDGVSVSCPTLNSENSEYTQLKLSSLLLATNAPILGGKLPEDFVDQAREKGKRVIDYFESETLQIRNATPTAEGAVAVAMSHLQITLCGCCCAVIGFGRIGQRISHLLSAMGAKVTVAARSLRSLAQAESFGFSTVRINENEKCRGLLSLGNENLDVIFNTVPSRLFDREVLSSLEKTVLLIDLASVPGGVDFLAAKEEGICAVWALSIPGKYAPLSAGRIISETLLEYLESEGII